MQPAAHFFLQPVELSLAGAVTGIVAGGHFQQLFGGPVQGGILGSHLHKMKAAHQHIRLEPGDNVQDPLVGAAAEKDALSILLNQQVLLVKEGVRVAVQGQSGAVSAVGPGQVIAGRKGDTRGDFQGVIGKNKTGPALQLLGQADEFAGCVLVETEGIPPQVYWGGAVDFQEPDKAVSVVIVAVGKDGKIDRREVDAERFCVVGEGAGLAGIEEDFKAAGLDVQAQTVLGGLTESTRFSNQIIAEQNSCHILHRTLIGQRPDKAHGIEEGRHN